MTTFEEWFSQVDAPPASSKRAWNAALNELEESLDTAENIGDVKDTIKYMKTDE